MPFRQIMPHLSPRESDDAIRMHYQEEAGCRKRPLDSARRSSRATEAKLRALMAQTRSDTFQGRLPHIITLTSGPSVLGAGSTTKSSIISLRSGALTQVPPLPNFFLRLQTPIQAGNPTPKDGYLTADDQTRVIAWCSNAVERLKLKSWDSVFIPINEDRQHWYSVHIDFSRKQINVYDSLGKGIFKIARSLHSFEGTLA
ncbi:hypothetical protein D9757_012970 [Collybiopsis confluens]|uniref:Ubiquitin-like protease family profile domain-containing protein n=1 Tax=Collybiopsis confluens TaxID=2823264 RepID=A0A8H5CMS1_9AGAR|nr:hypothetical protein D9757_015312 [Collybiopsis confluens]KAF5358565.1 hypothetical protein D9757_012970 [Collybiopsis confluens]